MKSPFEGVITCARCARARDLLFTLVTCMVLSVPAGGQTDAPSQRPLFTWRDGVLAGGFVVGTFAIRPLDKRAATAFQDSIPQNNRHLHLAARSLNSIAAPGAVIIGTSMYAAGRISKNNRLQRLGLYGTEALFIGEAVAGVMKNVFGRARPYVDTVPNPDNWQLFRGFRSDTKHRSFPSGHTVAGFAAAAAVTAQTSVWWPEATWVIGPTMYSGAALIGMARMYDNRHWASDVIVGAAIGTFAGIKVVRYHRTHPDNALDKWLITASLTPGNWSQVSLSAVPIRTPHR